MYQTVRMSIWQSNNYISHDVRIFEGQCLQRFQSLLKEVSP